jgi:hypothetical protein
MIDPKKRFTLIVAIVLLFALVNTAVFFMNNNNSGNSVSGFVTFNVNDEKFNLNISQIAFLTQWIVAFLIIAVANIKYVKSKNAENIKKHYIQVKEKHGKSNTDLDALYSVLKANNSLKITTISEVFKVDKEKALEWAKILENSNLAQIQYPAFADAELILKNEEKSPK